jgi:hypothetical protein
MLVKALNGDLVSFIGSQTCGETMRTHSTKHARSHVPANIQPLRRLTP